MKKILLMIYISIALTLFPSIAAYAVDNSSYKSAILMDYKSGRVLYEKDKDMVLPQASITKLMTYYVIKDYLKNNNISESTIINVNLNGLPKEEDASGIGLKSGMTMSISDLISSMLVVSANDSAAALESLYEESGKSFIEAMNTKALEIGLKNTIFVNPTGLTEGDKEKILNTTSAYDIAYLAKNIIRDYPEILRDTSRKTLQINGKSFTNTNGTLKYNNRIDGLKTGYTSAAGYCLAATENINGNRSSESVSNTSAVTDDIRFISVVLGCGSEEERVKESLMLLDYGEKNYSYEQVLSKNDMFKFQNELYKGGIIAAKPQNDFFTLKKKDDSFEKIYSLNDKLPGKIKTGDLIGSITIKDKTNGKDYSFELYSVDNYNKVNIFKRMYLAVRKFVNNVIYKIR